MRIRYVDNWQRARTEQHCQMIYDEESYPLGLIEYYKQRIDQEQRIHADVVLLMNVAIEVGIIYYIIRVCTLKVKTAIL